MGLKVVLAQQPTTERALCEVPQEIAAPRLKQPFWRRLALSEELEIGSGLSLCLSGTRYDFHLILDPWLQSSLGLQHHEIILSENAG